MCLVAGAAIASVIGTTEVVNNAIANGSSSKEAVWNVNTEKDYHESKQEKSKESYTPVSGKYFWSRVGSFFLILMAVMTVGYFIIFPSRGTYTSDCYDSLLWANAAYESGEVFSENYSYAALRSL